MRSRGRISAAHNEAAEVVIAEFGTKRPDPPEVMSERQAAIWRETTAAEPAGFFATGAVLAMLADYCRHREVAEKLTAMIDAFKDEWLNGREGMSRYHTLLKMRELETRGAAFLATKLRLTNQSRYRSDKADKLSQQVPGSGGKQPWE